MNVIGFLAVSLLAHVYTTEKFEYAKNSEHRPLFGYLHLPQGTELKGVVIFNHGSESDPASMTGQGTFFAQHQIAVWVPHRPGQGASSNAE